MSLWQEMRRRHVIRVAVLYAGTAFVVLQGVQLLGEGLGLPGWVFRAFTLLALAGFPLALVLAWALEMTPEGIRRAAQSQAGPLQGANPIPAWQKALAIALVASLVGAGWWLLRPAPTRYDSIAVLPFVELGASEHGDYFGDGLAEELLNALGNVPALQVAARTSAFSFKGKDVDIREIASKLGVVTVLEGSVRRGGDSVRIAAQLIDARSGFRIWHGEYDRGAGDLFALQNRIAREIVDAMSIELGVADKDRLVRGGTQNAAAYDLYLKARQRWGGRQVSELRLALDEMRQAVRLDPDFALAWSGLSDVIDALAWRDVTTVALVPEGRAAAMRALVLAPDLPEAWASLGIIVGEFDQDWVVGEHALQRAVALRPSYAQAQLWLADIARYRGHIGTALEMYERAMKADPLSLPFKQNYGVQLARYGDPARALALLQEVLTKDPGIPEALGSLASTPRLPLDADARAGYARRWAAAIGFSEPERAEVLGRALNDASQRTAALQVLDRIENEIGWNESLSRFAAVLGDRERTLALLEKGQAKNVGGVLGVGVIPAYAFLADDPRFRALVARQGLPVDFSWKPQP